MTKNKNPAASRQYSIPGSRHRQRGILGRLFKSSNLEIQIKDQAFSFSNLADFKSFLQGKTEIPTSKMQEMLKRTDLHLQEEIKQLSLVEQTINEKLAATIREPKSIDTYLDGATMVRFSQDYDWRQVMFELSKHSTHWSEYKLEAVTYYVKYLRSRIGIAHSILKDKSSSKPIEDSNPPNLMETMETRSISAEDLQAAQDNSDEVNLKKFKETSVNLSELKEEGQTPAELKRIPRGQTVVVDISSTKILPIKVASRKFVIDLNGEPKLVNKNGDSYPLHEGENLIGRSTKCTIILNPEFVDISRQHLIVELYPQKELHFTDLSSSGSQVPADSIKE